MISADVCSLISSYSVAGNPPNVETTTFWADEWESLSDHKKGKYLKQAAEYEAGDLTKSKRKQPVAPRAGKRAKQDADEDCDVMET